MELSFLQLRSNICDCMLASSKVNGTRRAEILLAIFAGCGSRIPNG